MTPLQRLGMGVLFLLVPVRFAPTEVTGPFGPVVVFFDGLPNPVGWALVIWGLLALPAAFPRRQELLAGALVSLAVSVPLWFPDVQEVTILTPELGWVASLPQGLTLLLLCLALLAAPANGFCDDLPPGRRFPDFGLRATAIALGVSLAAPPLIFGGGLTVLALPADAAVSLGLIYLIWTLFRLHRYVPGAVAPERSTSG
ncbi:hypothetical protein KLP28_06955 [Nocardioidaceae bacterium]|nr:hypothetical protein KLP28_06955 [Nocardioidaceae bacterium]